MDIPTAAAITVALGTTLGWAFERGVSDSERLTRVETSIEFNAEKIGRVADGVARVENLLLENGYGEGKRTSTE